MIYVLNRGFHGPLAYAGYVLSTYALVISIIGDPGITTGFVQWIKAHPLTRKMLRIPLVKRFVGDVRFRTSVPLYQGLIVNLLYIAIKLMQGTCNSSSPCGMIKLSKKKCFPSLCWLRKHFFFQSVTSREVRRDEIWYVPEQFER